MVFSTLHHAFGQLQLQALRGRTAGGDGLANLLYKVRLAKLLALTLTAMPTRGQMGLLRPGVQLLASALQHPQADGQDQVAGLGQGNEFAGRDHAALRVLPAQQHLGPAGAALAIDL